MAGNTNTLRVLIVEDDADQAARLELALQRDGQRTDARRVETKQEFVEALESTWDVVLCNYSLPHLCAPEALQELRSRSIDLPFVIVSGAVGEEQAAESLRDGAHDFVSRSNLARLHAVVEREITDVAMRHEHRRLQEAYSRLVENSLQGLLILQDERVAFANQAAAEILAISVDRLLQLSARDLLTLVHSHDEVEVESRMRSLLRGGATEIRLECRLGDGSSRRWIAMRAGRITLEGRPAAQVALIDITATKTFEEVLQAGKLEWERTFDAVRELILIVDDQGRVVRLNRAACSPLGSEPRDFIGRPVEEVIGAGPGVFPLPAQGAESADFEVTSGPLDSTYRFSVTPRWTQEGVLSGAILVGRDVTLQRRAEEVRRRQLEISQTEHIFRTFRHEIGNALNTLKTTLTVLRERYEQFTLAQRDTYFERCMQAFRMAENLLRALRGYQDFDRVRLRTIELRSLLLNRADLLFERARRSGIECQLELDDAPLTAELDPEAFTRILLNVVDNAVNACRNRTAPTIRIGLFRHQEQVVVEVRDTGCGMAPEDVARAFSPLFSTTPDGSGMGLAIVQKLMVRMNGLATLSSELGRWTTVELRLPMCTGEAARQQPATAVRGAGRPFTGA